MKRQTNKQKKKIIILLEINDQNLDFKNCIKQRKNEGKNDFAFDKE